ncbi:hypothetical protein ACHAWF_003898 [Thalassiosira exigua]
MSTAHHRPRRRPGAPRPKRAAAVALASLGRGLLVPAATARKDDGGGDGDDGGGGRGELPRLVTSYAGRRATSGVLFDVRAKRPLVVRGLEANVARTAPSDGPIAVEVWTRSGGFRGSEGDEGAWRLWANVTTVAGRGPGVPTPIVSPGDAVAPLAMADRERRAFYVSCPGGRHLLVGDPDEEDGGRRYYIDENLILWSNGAARRGKPGGFEKATIEPRLFGGAVLYEVAPGGESPVAEGAPILEPQSTPSSPQQLKTLATTFGRGVSVSSGYTYAGHMFDVLARARGDVEIASIAFHTYKEEYVTVSLYTKAGEYRGFDKDLSGWTMLCRVSVLGRGLGYPTFIPEGAFDPVQVRRGHRQAFYVTAEGPYLRAAGGTEEGSPSTWNPEIVIYEGAGKKYPVEGGTIAPRAWNGVLKYRVIEMPSEAPTTSPTDQPTKEPTKKPTKEPTRQPTKRPTLRPTRKPTKRPTPRPTPGPREFRLRLYWQRGYYWQESSREMWWCMRCRNNCRSGDSVDVDWCGGSKTQRFVSQGETLRPAVDPSLCLTSTGYQTNDRPLRVYRCDGGSDQRFEGLQDKGRFEIRHRGRCISQQHHPKEGERVYPEECRKTRDHDTTYWIKY